MNQMPLSFQVLRPDFHFAEDSFFRNCKPPSQTFAVVNKFGVCVDKFAVYLSSPSTLSPSHCYIVNNPMLAFQ
jgi:hypothetical protein